MFTDSHDLIVIYGRSLLLDRVELTLRQNASVEPCPHGRFSLLRLEPTPRRLGSDEALAPLADVPPGTMIYDRDQMDGTAVYQLLTDYPGWQFVGLTASKESVLILSSKQENGRFLADIINEVMLLRATAKA